MKTPKLFYLGEPRRGCGHRIVGGLYLVGLGEVVPCDRLPYKLDVCPTCGSGIKPSRGWTWINWLNYAKDHPGCKDPYPCPICGPSKYLEGLRELEKIEKYALESEEAELSEIRPEYGLLWVGGSHYGTEDFIKEAMTLGVSKRIAHIPKGLVLGKTWVLFAHKEAWINIEKAEWGKPLEKGPGIFYAFRPKMIEKVLIREETTEEEIKNLEKQGITPILVDRDKCLTKKEIRKLYKRCETPLTDKEEAEIEDLVEKDIETFETTGDIKK